MTHLIPTLDALVRRFQGVFEFTDDPEVFLRLRRGRLREPLSLDQGVFCAGTPVLELHLWNERVPPLPCDGPDVEWAARAARRLQRSLRLAAAHVQKESATDRAGLVGATTILVDGPASERLLRRLGFELFPRSTVRASPSERLRNRYALALMETFNPLSARGRRARLLRRTDLWMTMESFLQRHAPTPATREGRSG